MAIMAIGSHIIPKFYLEQFSFPSRRPDNPGRIWVYGRGMPPDERATSKQGVENGYFGYVGPDGILEESLETRLATLEAECNEVLPLIKSDLFVWSYTVKKKLAFYAALLFQRATQSRNISAKYWQTIQDGFAETIADEKFIVELADLLRARFKQETTPAALRTRLTILMESLRKPSEAKNAYLDRLLVTTEYIQSLLLIKPWQIWKAPLQSEFIASDNPVVTFIRLANRALNPGFGFQYPGVVVAFPVAPNTCLAMGPVGPETVKFDHTHVMLINEVIARLSDKFVYARTKSEEIQKLVDGCGGAAKYGESAFMPREPDLPSIKNFLRQHLGLPPDESRQ